MKLVALTYGTEADTRPIAVVCRALMDAGHDVTLLADGGTLGSARDLGVPHAALAGNIRGALQLGISSAVAGKNSLNATAQALARIANENADAWMRQVLEVAAGSDGLIVAGLAAFIGFSAAEKLASRRPNGSIRFAIAGHFYPLSSGFADQINYRLNA
jgi:sterol 3beta-glucosyltransferase